MNYQLLGRQARELRQRQGMTQEQLAEAAGLSVPYLSHIERATKKPSLESLVRLSAALDVTVDRLLAGNQPKDNITFRAEAQSLLEDCAPEEQQLLIDIAGAIKSVLRNHRAA